MIYDQEAIRPYQEKLRELGFLSDGETVVGVEDDSRHYKRGGQVFWWPVTTELQDGTRRRYVMKCPYDTFGDGIPAFVRERVQRSQILREANVEVPRIREYDRGTFVHEYVEGVELGDALKRATQEQRESLLRQKAEIIRKCEELGLVLMDRHDGNFIVGDNGKVTLLDLDFNQKK